MAEGQALADGQFPHRNGRCRASRIPLAVRDQLRPALEAMGRSRVCRKHELSAEIVGTGRHASGLSQKVDMKLDRQGVHAHAFTFGGGIIGGILQERPLHSTWL